VIFGPVTTNVSNILSTEGAGHRSNAVFIPTSFANFFSREPHQGEVLRI
jgi:hypothetical protein